MRTRGHAILVALCAAALGGALVFTAGATPRAAAPRPAHARLTARFLAEARSALIKDLRGPEPALWVHGRAPSAVNGTITAAGSYNWAGYADISSTSGAFTKVTGGWKVPAITCTTEDRITAQWVGLDGATTGTVEQDGTAEQCFEGKALYTSWYEMYPAGSITVGSTVAAGDSISALVSRSGSSYTLKLTDSTHTANSFTKTASCATSTCLDESAEWITERPAYGTTGIVPEAQFKSATFYGGTVTAKGTTSSISGYSGTVYDITCVDSTDSYDIVTTSGLNSVGKSFTNVWKNSY
jgi:hypothetical protein